MFIGWPRYSMECDQMRFSFQQSASCGLHTSSTSVGLLGSHWLKKSSTADMTSSYKFFSQHSYVLIEGSIYFWLYIYIYIYVYIVIHRQICFVLSELISVTIVYIHLFNGYQDLNSYMKRLAINVNGNMITSFARELNPTGVGEYISPFV